MLVQIVEHFTYYAEESQLLMNSHPLVKKAHRIFLDLADAFSSQIPKFTPKLISIPKNASYQEIDEVFDVSNEQVAYWSLISLKLYLDPNYLNDWFSRIKIPNQSDYNELRYISNTINHVFLNILSSHIFKNRVNELEYKFINFYIQDIHLNGLNTGNLLGMLEISDVHGSKFLKVQNIIANYLNSFYENNINVPSISDKNNFYSIRDFYKMKKLWKVSLSYGWQNPLNNEDGLHRQELIDFIIKKKNFKRPTIDMETRFMQLSKQGKTQHEIMSILRDEGYFQF
ncbi:MAG: hypothetical protein H6622_14045 [Halobacteriovoraceae bacterium]|nr:hypothetical protein [Halobacteriovoraceae bacterium]